MAIKLIANYSKKLGLPGYSSHQFSVSVETELVTNEDMASLTDGLQRLRENAVQLARSDAREVLARFGQMGARKLAVAS